jgi:hypothetical protein
MVLLHGFIKKDGERAPPNGSVKASTHVGLDRSQPHRGTEHLLYGLRPVLDRLGSLPHTRFGRCITTTTHGKL